ncbi:MAG: hypothetical protein INH43_16225 [Acidobacteriaceae bacterium]|nr:hypothetical protein [Acidobacteriaceae bacterium]
MANFEKVLLVNGMWRAGTTYFWSKIRENSQWRCYYEPLHEVLSVYHPSRNDDNMREEVWRMMRHPAMSVGYFHEYPLSDAGLGVPGYSAKFAYERFLLDETDNDPALECYFQSLIDFASSFGQRTCLQPNRLFLRSSWFTARFPSVHVFVSRHWWDLWRSMLSFPNAYFPSRFYLIATLNAAHPLMRPLVENRSLPLADTLFYTGEETQVVPWLADRVDVFRFFYHVYVCAVVLSCADADAVVDLTVAERAPAMWQALNLQLASEGIHADFSDCQPPFYPRDEEFSTFEAVAAQVEARILTTLPSVRIPAERIPPYLPNDSPLKQVLIRFAGDPAAG